MKRSLWFSSITILKINLFLVTKVFLFRSIDVRSSNNTKPIEKAPIFLLNLLILMCTPWSLFWFHWHFSVLDNNWKRVQNHIFNLFVSVLFLPIWIDAELIKQFCLRKKKNKQIVIFPRKFKIFSSIHKIHGRKSQITPIMFCFLFQSHCTFF